MDTNKMTSIELCVGAGLSTEGARQAGIDCIIALDNWHKAQIVFENNFMADKFIPFWLTDMRCVTGNDLLSRAGLEQMELPLLTFTTPCPHFSNSGLKNPMGELNALFLHGIELVSQVKPLFFMAENVEGMTMPAMTPIFNEIKYRFREKLSDYIIMGFILDAHRFGSCQSRRRTIFVGVHRDLGIAPPFPIPDDAGAANRKIRDILPYAQGVYAGQSEKFVRLPHQPFMTVTASECFKLMVDCGLRNPTVEELKKIGGLPESFTFEGVCDTDAGIMIGNGVPVPFMRAIMEAIRDAYLRVTCAQAS